MGDFSVERLDFGHARIEHRLCLVEDSIHSVAPIIIREDCSYILAQINPALRVFPNLSTRSA